MEDMEDELVRIAAWEGCAHAVIVALKKAHAAKEVRLLGCSFLKVCVLVKVGSSCPCCEREAPRLTPLVQTAAEVPRLRGLLALSGAFDVLLRCTSLGDCISEEQMEGAIQAEHAMDALVQGTEDPVHSLLNAFRSQSISCIEDALLQIQKWMPKSNTEAEVVVGE